MNQTGLRAIGSFIERIERIDEDLKAMITKTLSFSVPPGYRRRQRPASKKLGPFMAWIDAILEGALAE